MKRFVPLALAAAMLLFAGCAESAESAPPLADSISVVYDTVAVERGDVVATLVYDGYVMPKLGEAAFEEVSGEVAEVFVRVGDEAAEGEALLKLDTEALETRLALARESLEELESGRSLERRLLEIDLELANLSLDEVRDGGDATEISLAEIEVERRENALSDYDRSYEKRGAAAREQIAELESEIEACTLRAPSGGTVVSTPGVGTRASASTALVIIASDEGRYIRCASDSVPSGRRAYIALDGEQIELSRVEYTDRENAAFEAAGEKPPVRFVRADGGELPACGEYLQICVEQARSENTLRLPTGAVWRDSGISYVYKIEDGERVYTEVKVGASSDAYVEILEGLEEGEEVYVAN